MSDTCYRVPAPYDMASEEEHTWTVEPLPQKTQIRKRREGGAKEPFVGMKLRVCEQSWNIVKSWSQLLELEESLGRYFEKNQMRVKLPPLASSPEAAAALPQPKMLASVASFFRDAMLLPGVLTVFVPFFLTDVEDTRGTLLDGPQIAGFLEKKKGEGNLKRTKRFCAIHHRMMSYFKKQGEVNPNGVIVLDGSICSLVEGGKGGFRLIQRDGTKYLFRPSTTEEARRWVDCISAGNEVYRKLPRVIGTLEVVVIAARDLHGRSESGLSSPFAVVYCDMQQARTAVVPNSLNPVWGDSSRMFFTVLHTAEVLYINIWSGSADHASFLGMCMLPLSVIPPNVVIDRWFALVPRASSEKVSGAVRLSLRMSVRPFEPDDDPIAGSKHFGLPLSTVLHSPGNTLPIPLVVGQVLANCKERIRDCDKVANRLFRLPNSDPDVPGDWAPLLRSLRIDNTASLEDVTSVLSFFLRALPEPLMTFSAFDQLPPLCLRGDEAAVTQWITVNVRAENKALLRYFCAFLRCLEQSCGQLNLDVLADMFTPVLLRPPSLNEGTVTAMLQQSVCLKYLLIHARAIFGDANLDNLVAEVAELRGSAPAEKAEPIVLKKSAISATVAAAMDDGIRGRSVSRATNVIKIDVDSLHTAIYGSQLELDADLVVGESCFAQYEEDSMWYPATIRALLPGGGARVEFDNYGNQQDCRPDQIAVHDKTTEADDSMMADLLSEPSEIARDENTDEIIVASLPTMSSTNPQQQQQHHHHHHHHQQQQQQQHHHLQKPLPLEPSPLDDLDPPPALPFAVGFMSRSFESVPAGRMVALLDEPRSGFYRIQVDSDVCLVPVGAIERIALIASPAAPGPGGSLKMSPRDRQPERVGGSMRAPPPRDPPLHRAPITSPRREEQRDTLPSPRAPVQKEHPPMARLPPLNLSHNDGSTPPPHALPPSPRQGSAPREPLNLSRDDGSTPPPHALPPSPRQGSAPREIPRSPSPRPAERSSPRPLPRQGSAAGGLAHSHGGHASPRSEVGGVKPQSAPRDMGSPRANAAPKSPTMPRTPPAAATQSGLSREQLEIAAKLSKVLRDAPPRQPEQQPVPHPQSRTMLVAGEGQPDSPTLPTFQAPSAPRRRPPVRGEEQQRDRTETVDRLGAILRQQYGSGGGDDE